MFYYEVLVASQRFHGSDALTYQSEAELERGQVVNVPLQNENVMGIVKAAAKQPKFATKAISSSLDVRVPETSLGLIVWLKDYYPAPLGALLQAFLPSSLAQKSRKKELAIIKSGDIEALGKSPSDILGKSGSIESKATTELNTQHNRQDKSPNNGLQSQPKELPKLTPLQVKAVSKINEQSPKPVLLHGITASGKTQVYLELAIQQVKNGKSVLVMTPEIGLTPQLVQLFTETFPGQVETVHSTLTPAEKRDVWLRIARANQTPKHTNPPQKDNLPSKANPTISKTQLPASTKHQPNNHLPQTTAQPIIVIGPRSALFTPINNLGLIVIDEAHDNAYKQEQAPYYQATRVAATLARLCKAQLVMGTATPLVDDYYAFKEKGLAIVELNQTAKQPEPQKTTETQKAKDDKLAPQPPHNDISEQPSSITDIDQNRLVGILDLNKTNTRGFSSTKQVSSTTGVTNTTGVSSTIADLSSTDTTQPEQQSQNIKTTVVNLRERQHFTRSAWLSTTLLESVTQALSKNEQALIFLNRRGTARLVLCSSCGWQALCPRCDLPLTYHGDIHQIQCHTCGFSQRAATSCPTCGSGDIAFRSVGTKSLVTELERLFPKARVARFDSDNKKDDRMEANYQSVADGDVDILVGTQVLTKGLDLPKLSVVGVVVADTGLYFPDYTAEEKTFQMLTQVLGRVGRGHRSGNVIVQTYSPDNPTIQQAINRDYAGFYEAQLRERQLYHFPPFFFVLKLRCGRKTSASAEQTAHKLAQSLLKQKLPIELSGPSTGFIEKSNNIYHWQIIVKAKQRTVLLEIIKQLPANWSYDIDPTNLL